MSTIPGTNVAAMVVPFDTADIYATHNDKYGRGGYRVCDTLTERDAIPDLRRKAGMWVRCLEDGKVYEMGAGLANADWVEVSITGGGGGDLRYHHVQGSASATWVITHNLGKYPVATVIDSAGSEVEGDLTYDSLNQITITFSAGFSGDAYLN